MKQEEAIELLENLKVCRQAHTLFNVEKEAVDMAIEALKAQKSGEWIETDDGDEIYGRLEKCTECGALVLATHMNYCGNCGADMRKKEGEQID